MKKPTPEFLRVKGALKGRHSLGKGAGENTLIGRTRAPCEAVRCRIKEKAPDKPYKVERH